MITTKGKYFDCVALLRILTIYIFLWWVLIRIKEYEGLLLIKLVPMSIVIFLCVIHGAMLLQQFISNYRIHIKCIFEKTMWVSIVDSTFKGDKLFKYWSLSKIRIVDGKVEVITNFIWSIPTLSFISMMISILILVLVLIVY